MMNSQASIDRSAPSFKGKADDLDAPSRDFYEYAKFKLSLSLFFAALAMMFLGLASSTGGAAQSISEALLSPHIDIAHTDNLRYERAGSAIACTVFVIAFLLTSFFACLFSPLLATANERLTLKSPTNFALRPSPNQAPNTQRPAPVVAGTVISTASSPNFGAKTGRSSFSSPPASAPPLAAMNAPVPSNIPTTMPSSQPQHDATAPAIADGGSDDAKRV